MGTCWGLVKYFDKPTYYDLTTLRASDQTESIYFFIVAQANGN